MPDYRLYRLDGDGRITFADWIQAESDQGAITACRELRWGDQRWELWLGDRLVVSLEGPD
jgi:hypothetical protein